MVSLGSRIRFMIRSHDKGLIYNHVHTQSRAHFHANSTGEQISVWAKYIISHHIVSHCIILHRIMLYYVSCCIVSYRITLYCIVLYRIVLHHIIVKL